MIYLDNASTSFPKPESVCNAVFEYMTKLGTNIGRGTYGTAYKTEEKVFETRQLVCNMINGRKPKNVVFTKNVTESINYVLKGMLKPGDHVLVSSVEHNAVMRPLTQLLDKGVTFSRIPCDREGNLITNEIPNLIRENTKAIVMTHASNVCGTMLPIQEVGEICKANGLLFVVDSAQTAGVFPIDIEKMNIDVLCFTGHKGLLGPQGIGGFYLKDAIVPCIEPLISGGTGSISHTENIPDFMPDRFEAGTQNISGIIGLGEGIKWINDTGMDKIRAHELELTGYMLKEFGLLEKEDLICVVGRKDCNTRTGTVSIVVPGNDMSEVAYRLDSEFDIATRVGLHCAPNAHKVLGTFPKGTIRFSVGWNNTKDDVDYAVSALYSILKG